MAYSLRFLPAMIMILHLFYQAATTTYPQRDTTTQRPHTLPSTTPHNTKGGSLGKRLGEMGPSSSLLTNLVGAATG